MIEHVNSSQLLSDFKKFNEIFRKYVTYGSIKSHKNQGFTPFLGDTFSEKPKAGVKLTPQPF